MANLFEHKDRRVIPNWRSFKRTTELGELDSINQNNKTESFSNIDEYIFDWKKNKTTAYASELLCASLVHNHINDQEVKDAAKYILDNENITTHSQLSIARRVLNQESPKDIQSKFFDITVESISSLISPEQVHNKIRSMKELILTYPYNPVAYVELSRLYSIIGQAKQSIKAMRSAIHLAPNNRFVLRAGVRLFTHYDCEGELLEEFHSLLKKTPIVKIDPWLMSAEISLATLRETSSRNIKRGVALINSKKISPFNLSELSSSIGTVELLSGGHKKSRVFFNNALLSPNDNSLAQVEWASTKDKMISLNLDSFDVKVNFEAKTIDDVQNSRFDSALENATKWFFDMPFSKRAIMFGSNLASTVMKDQHKAVAFLKAGLISHPNDPQIINNLAYSYALDGNTEMAFDQLRKLQNPDNYDDTTRVCLKATLGLAFFRSGKPEFGRSLYMDAIEYAKSVNEKELNWKAFLNYAREEILIGSEEVDKVMDVVKVIPKDSDDIEMDFLRKDVEEKFLEYKKMQS